jgi:hypothetical protein
MMELETYIYTARDDSPNKKVKGGDPSPSPSPPTVMGAQPSFLITFTYMYFVYTSNGASANTSET